MAGDEQRKKESSIAGQQGKTEGTYCQIWNVS